MKNSLTWVVFCFVLCFRGSDHSLKFISALQGETIVLKYSSNATCVDWYGPARDEKEFRPVDELDMYNQSRKWNISLYSDDALIKDSLPHKTRLDIIGNHTIGEFFLEIRNVSAKDAGLYRCQIFTVIMTNITSVINSFEVQVKYPPSVMLRNHSFTPSDSKRTIQCITDGNPKNYTYGNWEHMSFFNKHIRFILQRTENLILPIQEKRNRYQDSGIYVCSVSNGVPNVHGEYFQKGHSFVFSKGPPVVVKENKRIQYGEYGKQMDLKINVYSLSTITCQLIATTDGEVIPLEAEKNLITTSDEFYGKQLTLYGWQVVFRFTKLTANQLRKYNVTLCNEYGNISYVTEIQSKGHESKKNKTTLIALTVCAIVLAVIVLVIVKCLVSIRKRNKLLYVEDVVQAVEGESEAVENILYQSRNQNMPDTSNPSPGSTLIHEDTSSEITLTEQGTVRSPNMQRGELMENHLNYADVVFRPSSSQNEVRIIGLENRTVYADVDTSIHVSLPDIQSDRSSSDDDFVYIEGIQNFIEKRETND